LFLIKLVTVHGTKRRIKKIQPNGSFKKTIMTEADIILIIVYLFSVNIFIIIIGIVEKKAIATPINGIYSCELNNITVRTVKKAVIDICLVI